MAQTDPAGKSAPPGGFQNLGWYSGFQYYQGSFAPQVGVIHPQSPQQGAGQPVSAEVRAQSAAQQGVTPQQFDKFLAEQGFSDKGQVTQFLNDYQSALSVPDEFKAPSLEELQKQLTPTTPSPEPFKRVEEFERRRTEMGVADLETRLNDLKAQEDEAVAQLRINVAAERGKPVALGVIEGRISEQTRMAQENLDFIGRQKSRVIDELNTANNVISLYVQLGGQDYEDAVNRYNNEFTQNLQIYDLWRGLRRDELDERQRQRDNARANLQIYATALMEGNLDYGSLGADQKLMLNRLEVQSGLPIGFTSGLHMSAKDRLLTVNEKTGEALVVGENGQMKVIQTGLRPTPKEATASEKQETKFFSDAKSIQPIKVGSNEVGIFPLLVKRYAGTMSLGEIYDTYSRSDTGKAFGRPVEDEKDIRDIYAEYK